MKVSMKMNVSKWKWKKIYKDGVCSAKEKNQLAG